MIGFMAIALGMVLGFGAMGIDVAMWYQQKRVSQNIADSAAVAARFAR